MREARNGSKRVKFFFFAFLRVSEHFESIETHFFFENFREREARNARVEKRVRCERKARSPRERSDRVAPQG